MTTKLYIDGIIYSLQKKGGISILFNEIITRLPKNFSTIGIEENINIEYLDALDNQHKKWIANTDIPTLTLSTEVGVSLDDNVQKIKDYVEQLKQLYK